MANLRKQARGEFCQIRIPGECNGDPDTTVLAHYRMSGLSGFGIKSEDIFGAWACSRCHDCCDFRVKTTFTRDEIRLMHAEGCFRTQAELIRRDALRW